MTLGDPHLLAASLRAADAAEDVVIEGIVEARSELARLEGILRHFHDEFRGRASFGLLLSPCKDSVHEVRMGLNGAISIKTQVSIFF